MRIAALLATVVALTQTWAAWGASVEVAGDRMLVVDGRRTFILGLYEDPADDAVLKQVAAAGFNLVQVPEKVEALDWLQAQGVYGWLNVGGWIDLSADRASREPKLRDVVARFGPHPALLAWEMPDEALWNCWYSAQTWRAGQEPEQQRQAIAGLSDEARKAELLALRNNADACFRKGDYEGMEKTADEIWRRLGKQPPNPDLNLSNAPQRAAGVCQGLIEGSRVVKALDPRHPVWMNHAPRNSIEQLARFNQAADIAGCDIYPVPCYRGGHSDLAERGLPAVGAYTRRMQDAAPGKPIWMVLQGFGWADINACPESERNVFRRPTFDESRFMAYDAVVRGARGILYWGTYSVEKTSEFWANLMKLVRELADLQPVLSAPDAAVEPRISYAETWGSVDRGVQVLPKEADGKTWLVVVNEWPEPREYTLSGLQRLEGVRYVVRGGDGEGTVHDGRLTFRIPGWGVQVLEPR